MYTEDLIIQMSTCIIWACARLTRTSSSMISARAKVLSFEAIVLEISLRSSSITVVQMELSRRNVVCCGQLLFAGLSIADNGRQGELIITL